MDCYLPRIHSSLLERYRFVNCGDYVFFKIEPCITGQERLCTEKLRQVIAITGRARDNGGMKSLGSNLLNQAIMARVSLSVRTAALPNERHKPRPLFLSNSENKDEEAIKQNE